MEISVFTTRADCNHEIVVSSTESEPTTAS